MKHKDILTPVQYDLLMILKTIQSARYDSPPVDLGKVMLLIQQSGISLRDEYGYGNKSFTFNTKPEVEIYMNTLFLGQRWRRELILPTKK